MMKMKMMTMMVVITDKKTQKFYLSLGLIANVMSRGTDGRASGGSFGHGGKDGNGGNSDDGGESHF